MEEEELAMFAEGIKMSEEEFKASQSCRRFSNNIAFAAPVVELLGVLKSRDASVN